MNDENRISDRDDKGFILKFATVWMLFFIYLFVATSYSIFPLIFIAVAIGYFPYHLSKIRELHYDGSSLYIKTRIGYESVDISNIERASTSMVFSGYYRVNFLNSAIFGGYILYAPRKKGRFSKYPLLKEFIARANQNIT